MPAFAIGRTQTLLYQLNWLRRSQAIPERLPVYLDSPMAIDATALYLRHRALHRLDAAECEAMCRGATLVNTAEESKRLDSERIPRVILAASGMATGGRVVHHIKALAPDPRNTLLFTGYQAEGTRGAAILARAPKVRIHGEDVRIRAEVVAIEGLSAHADQAELVAWLRESPIRPGRTFVSHAEPAAGAAMREHIERDLGWRADVAEHEAAFEL